MESTSSICEVCCVNVAKYKCPKCYVGSCCLLCSRNHKLRSDCDGIGQAAGFVSMQEFGNLNLLNDYRLLEQAVRVLDNCKRDKVLKLRSKFVCETSLQSVQRECLRHNIRLELLPASFEKHHHNTSHFNSVAETIFWKIRWIFVGSKNVDFCQDRVPDSLSIRILLKNIIHARRGRDPVSSRVTEKLKSFSLVDLSRIHCFMPVERNGWTKGKRFYELDHEKSIRANLHMKILIEFPTLYVCTENAVGEFPILTDKEKIRSVTSKLWCKSKKQSGPCAPGVFIDASKRSAEVLGTLFNIMEENCPVDLRLHEREKQHRAWMVEREKQSAVRKEGKQLKTLVKQSKKVAKTNILFLKRRAFQQRRFEMLRQRRQRVVRHTPLNCLPSNAFSTTATNTCSNIKTHTPSLVAYDDYSDNE